MKLVMGSDHAGFALKRFLFDRLNADGHDVVDVGAHDEVPSDYPLYCADVARRVASGEFVRGIVTGGSGQGEAIAANKFRGARAALCNDLYTARMARLHNDANILSIGARIVAPQLAEEIMKVFLTTEFEGGRHERRIKQISELER